MDNILIRYHDNIRVRHRHQIPRHIPDRTNPLEFYTEEQVRQRYRFRPQTILYIVDLVAPDLELRTLRALSPLYQVLVALRFFSCGTYQRVIGDATLPVSVSSVCRCIHNVSRALCRYRNDFIKLPVGDEVNRAKSQFHKIARKYQNQNALHKFL